MLLKAENILNILVIRSDRFGEFLLNIPAIRALKETYPQAKIILAVNSQVKDLAEAVEYADKVVIWDRAFIKSLRRQGIDICVVLNPMREAHLAVFLAGIPLRVGYNRKWGFLLTHKIPDKKGLGLKHEIESNLELVSLIGAKTNDRSVGLARLPLYNNPEYAGAVAVHPFTSDAVKQWPMEQFRMLVKRLSEEFNCRVIVIGKEAPVFQGREKFDSLGRNVINLINRTSLLELAQILKRCRLLVTCDSGPMHLAVAVGVPVIALFRDDLQGKTAKRWGPKSSNSLVIEKNSLSDISVNEVLENVRKALKI